MYQYITTLYRYICSMGKKNINFTMAACRLFNTNLLSRFSLDKLLTFEKFPRRDNQNYLKIWNDVSS